MNRAAVRLVKVDGVEPAVRDQEDSNQANQVASGQIPRAVKFLINNHHKEVGSHLTNLEIKNQAQVTTSPTHSALEIVPQMVFLEFKGHVGNFTDVFRMAMEVTQNMNLNVDLTQHGIQIPNLVTICGLSLDLIANQEVASKEWTSNRPALNSQVQAKLR